MEEYEIHNILIRNMICSRCMKVIRLDLEALGVEVLELQLGRLKIRFPQGQLELSAIEKVLLEDEFEIVKDKNDQIAEEVKLTLIDIVNHLPILQDRKLSEVLAEKFQKDYWSLSKIFSKTETVTVEKYFILLRIEKAKELIEYEELTFSQIAYELGFGNISHLSGQFKQVTGMSMTEYKKLENKNRSPLDKLL
ncbi:MAG: AraC family transcriptional regulator [Saprospiraceae bacterium]